MRLCAGAEAALRVLEALPDQQGGSRRVWAHCPAAVRRPSAGVS